MTTPTALTDLRVIEISRDRSVTIPYAARLLGDLGAEVVIVEPSLGHPLRESVHGDEASQELASAVFAYLASGKKSVAVDLSSDDRRLAGVLASADVLLTDLRPEELAELGVDVADGGAGRVVVFVTPWGLDGPYAGYAASGLVLQAAAGWVGNRMDPSSPVVQVGGNIHEWSAGSFVASAALMAWRAQRTGPPVTVDFSMMECLHSTLPYSRLVADTNADMGGPAAPSQVTPFGVRPCADGWVGINILTGQQWIDACLLTELDDYADQQLDFYLGRGNLADFQVRLLEWLSHRTVSEVVDLGQSLRIPVVPVANGQTITESAQWLERPWFVPLGDDGRLQRPGPPWRLAITPAHAQRSVPTVDKDGQLLDELMAGRA